jgi:hypothetical protein
MKHERSILSILALALAMSWGGCAGSGAPSAPEQPVPPEEPGSPSPEVVASSTALAFGPAEEERALTLTNRGAAPVAWRAEVTASWLAVAPAAGELPNGSSTIAIRVARQALSPGRHAGRVRIVTGATSIEVQVTADVEARPVVSLDRTTFDLGPGDASATVRIANVGNAGLDWSLAGPSWVAASPPSGALAPGAVQTVVLTPDRSGLAPGTHQAVLTLQSGGGTANLALRVDVAALASLRIQPAALDFGAANDAAAATIENVGGGPLAWRASAGASWLRLSASEGTIEPGRSHVLSVFVDRTGLPGGTHRASIAVTSNGGDAAITVDAAVVPQSSTFALAGEILDQFSGAGMGGLLVQLDGVGATTDANGRFTIPGTPSSSLKTLTITGGGVHPRATFARGTDTRWLAIPSTFDLGSFNDVAREYEPRTIRWLGSPAVYVDTQPEGFAAGPELDQWIAEARSAAAGFVSQWSGGAINATSVTVTSSPPPDGTPGTIVIHFSEDPGRYSGERTVGMARTVWSFRRDIVAATIWLRFSLVAGPGNGALRVAVLGHELGHGMGMGHMDGGTSSIMTPRISVTSLSTFDERTGGIVYSRSPGNTDPDSDNLSSFTGALVPAAAPAGRHEWICDAPIDRRR